MRILLIEDDTVLLNLLADALTSQHYIVDTATNGLTGWDYSQSTTYDLILLDVELPKLDGVTLCQRLRAAKCTTPILLMTAREASSERVRGLDSGADDYLIKPLDLAELQARIRALLRRGEVVPTGILQVGELRLDPRTCEVTYGETIIEFRPKEYSLLEVFLRNPSRVFSRAQLVEYLWTFDDSPQEDSVKAHIKGLRQRLKTVGIADWIENVYGLGYRLKEGVADAKSQKTEGTNLITSGGVEDWGRQESPSPQATSQMQKGLDKLWQQSRGLMLERLMAVRQAVGAIATGTLSTELRQEARQAAHKLAGVLGMFDRPTGTKVARQIEEIFLSDTLLAKAGDGEQLVPLVRELEHLLDLEDLEQIVSKNAAPLLPINPEPSLGQELPQSQNHSVKVLVVDDDPIFLAALRSMLEPWGIRMIGLELSLQFWDVLRATVPDLLILDVDMPQRGGIELCQAVRLDADWQSLPILFLTIHSDRETIQELFAAGADDYITKPVFGQELLTRLTNRLDRTRQLQALATKDPLTGLVNQPQSSRTLESLLHQASTAHPVCLVLLKVPQLSQINLQFGHATGNHVLQRWAQLLQSNLHDAAAMGYWGNGEFVVGLSGFTKADSETHLSQFLATLRQQVFTAPDGRQFQVMVCSGIAESPADGLKLQTLYQLCWTRSQIPTF
ncbi:response regulator [Desmonostoc muscorum CCALA 125]|nr:response regulator [Desmonostoc muscorum CCALA 125]